MELKQNLYEPFYPLVRKLEQARNPTAFLKSEANWLYRQNPDSLMVDWRSAKTLKF